jgi:pyruvate-formate lyase-activating enzyme
MYLYVHIRWEFTRRVSRLSYRVKRISASLIIIAKLKLIGVSKKIHLLPYHRPGETKYERLECANKSASIQPPSEEYVLKLKEFIESFVLMAFIGR